LPTRSTPFPYTTLFRSHYSDEFADLDAGYGFKFETVPIHPSLQALAVPWESAAGHRDRMAKLPKTALVGILLRDRFGGRVRVDRSEEHTSELQSRFDLV